MPHLVSRRAAPSSSTVLGPRRLPDGVLTMRSPELADGPAWSAARLANQEWLEPAFPAWGADWAAEQGPATWAQRWWQLRRGAAAGRAKPFVLLLDGRLIGELGVDAVDEVSGAGEASAWMVRSHGSAAVMNAASLLLIEHAFSGPRPMDRLLSPVATTSRRGRSPALRAIGMDIEATVPRKVGARGLVDHDIWVLHNTAAGRAAVATALRSYPQAPAPAGVAREDPRTVLPAAGRALARGAVSCVRSARHRPVPTAPVALACGATLRPPAGRDLAALAPVSRLAGTGQALAIEVGGRVVGGVAWAVDPGTATTDVVAQLVPGAERRLLADALEAVLGRLRATTSGEHLLTVRVPRVAEAGTVPDHLVLRGLGLDRLASYRGNPEGSRAWTGEELWGARA